MITWAESYFDHYERILGAAQRRDVFEITDTSSNIQVLAYKNVFPGCITFCTIGLSSFESRVGAISELVMTVDEGWEYIPKLLAESASFLIEKPMRVGWGFVIGGESQINSQYYEKFLKEATYFTHPMGFPDDFFTIRKKDSDKVGEMYMGIPISVEEKELFASLGAEEFESKMEENNVDPFCLSRNSVVT
tara:strand:- start:794 stop:1366 length:573 start_codon:yes stop_codon:yes gene_type:complete